MKKWIMGIVAIGLAAGGLTGIMLNRDTGRTDPLRSHSVEFHEGQMIPALIFPRLRDGRPGSVADFRGKKLILHIFASW